MRHVSQWEIARLEAEARPSRDSLKASSSSAHKLNGNGSRDTNSNAKPPSDIFLKLWNSEAGKAFRKETTNVANIKNTKCKILDQTNPYHDEEFYGTETNPQGTFTPVSSFFLACSSYQGQIFNLKDHNQYSLEDHLSDDWMEEVSSNAHIGHAENRNKPANVEYSSKSNDQAINGHGRQEDEIGFSDIILDFPDSSTTPNNNNSNPDISSIGCMTTELNTDFELLSACPWTELGLDKD